MESSLTGMAPPPPGRVDEALEASWWEARFNPAAAEALLVQLEDAERDGHECEDFADRCLVIRAAADAARGDNVAAALGELIERRADRAFGPWTARAWLLVGERSYLQGDLGGSTRALELGLDALPPECARDRAHLTNGLGRAAFERGEYPEALRCFRVAMHIADETGDVRLAGMTRSNVANVLSEVGDLEAALAHYREGLARHRAAENPSGEANAAFNLAFACKKVGEDAEARLHCERCLDLVRASDPGKIRPAALRLAARLDADAGRLGDARRHADQALADPLSTASLTERTAGLLCSAAVARKADDPTRSRALLEEARTTSSSVENVGLVADLTIQLATLELDEGQPRRALEALEPLQTELDVRGDRRRRASALGLIVRGHDALGDAERALAAMRELRAVEHDLFHGEVALRIATLHVQSEVDSAQRREALLERSREELERRVAERTRRLTAANAALRNALDARRKSEEERAGLERQLFEAQKMDALGRLAGGMAHDFNNLLMVIRGYADLLVEEVTEERPRRAAARVLDAARRGSELTRRLLAFAREQPDEPGSADLGSLCDEARDFLAQALGEDVELDVAVCDPGSVAVGASELHQILLNLAVNARDAMPDGGRFTIRCERIRVLDDAELLPDDYQVLTVTDTGIGMDEPTIARAFDPFFTTKGPGKGTGLGLSIAGGILRQRGGALRVASEVGVGTTFRLFLPLAVEQEGATNEALDLRPALPAHILLVEDDPAVRELLEGWLSSRGHGVVAADSGDHALELARGEVIDVLVTDVGLPGMSGPELAKRIRAEHGELPVVFTSGHSAVAPPVTEEPGQAAFLQKPFALATLDLRISELLRGNERPSEAN